MRAALERELGETVSRRLAARLLGVSHTALERWIRDGDLPVVFSQAGRAEIPVSALLDLYESVEARYVLYRWREQRHIDDRHADRWERLLERPVAEIKRVIAEEGPEADDMRQNSPFAGLLSEPERRKIVREVR